MKPRVAFDLDDTLGSALIHPAKNIVVGFQIREGCRELLEELRSRFDLCIWTISSRVYLDKVMSFGLHNHFAATYSWDEQPALKWKDIRSINADYLIDDNPQYRECAHQEGIAHRYIIVPAFGSPEDIQEPLSWVRQVRSILLAQ